MVGSLVDNTPGTLTVSITPSSITNSTTSAVVSVSGGSGTYTYVWSEVFATGPSITADSPTSSSTTFTLSGTGSSTSTQQCTVTDSVNPGKTGFNNISVTLIDSGF